MTKQADDELLVPARDELVAVLKALPFIKADQETLEHAADLMRHVFRQPGRDDLDQILRTPAEGWLPEAELNCAADLTALADQIEKAGNLLSRLPSRGWQSLDAAEMAALVTAGDAEEEDDQASDLKVHWLLGKLADNAGLISQTLLFAAIFSGERTTKYRTQEFAAAAADAFGMTVGRDPTRRHDPYSGEEYGPFLEFVDAMRTAFRHPGSTARLTKLGVERWRLLRRMDIQPRKSR